MSPALLINGPDLLFNLDLPLMYAKNDFLSVLIFLANIFSKFHRAFFTAFEVSLLTNIHAGCVLFLYFLKTCLFFAISFITLLVIHTDLAILLNEDDLAGTYFHSSSLIMLSNFFQDKCISPSSIVSQSVLCSCALILLTSAYP